MHMYDDLYILSTHLKILNMKCMYDLVAKMLIVVFVEFGGFGIDEKSLQV